ncbi:hypothetical protein [Luteolibacter sp. LG18]|uniref:hypothetical protein n=1 Tax=Luteolibacter sp. LG18 TaxID=2819286 RepID=UPI002B2B7FD3|nr:hypothetical protein llg_32480 [Luteolibacter sp. LG18]
MTENPNHSPRPAKKPERGFALIVVLCLMILISIVALGMLSLASVTLRTSRSSELEQQARQNARLGMLLALGELQRTMGPDQRVSGTSALVDPAGNRPHLTGVWKGNKWNGGNTIPNWTQQKKDDFKGWLISGPTPQQLLQSDFAASAASGNLAKLVSPVGNETIPVQANIVALPDRGKDLTGGLAWGVFDQSEKISMTLPASRGSGIDTRLDRMASAPKPGYQAVSSLDWTSLANHESERQKLMSLDQGALTGLSAQDRSFHDLASHTEGLVVDVANGGFSKDLSRLFDTATLPSDYSSRYLYGNAADPGNLTRPLVPPPTRLFNNTTLPSSFPSPDPSWSLLQAHYRSYTLGTGGTTPLDITALPRTNPNAFNGQQICPVISKAQFVFSLSFGAQTAGASAYTTWLVIDPVITLWNPYNVPLRFTGGRIELYRVPLGFRLYKNGVLQNSQYTSLANTFLNVDFGGRANKRYLLNLLPEAGKSELIMAPGEHVVMTAHTDSKHFNQAYSNTGMDVRPGFFPPAGMASNREAGGVTTLNLCVNSAGAGTGPAGAYTVTANANDKIQVEVAPMHANVDSFAETGGKEITGFLKYYVNSAAPGVTNPVLVGGIELDYGSQESSILASYSKQQLPTFIVDPAIPRSFKADDRQPNGNPPVAICFKEPFLVTTFQQKTERNSRFPTRSWLTNSPVNLYASEGLDQTESWNHQQYEFQWEPMTDWMSSPTVEISNTRNRGYGGPGIYAQSGTSLATFNSLPMAPAGSLFQLRNAPLNQGGQLPLTSQIIGGSHPSPLMDTSAVTSTAGSRTYLDHCYLANNALFDSYFLSSAADRTLPRFSNPRSARQMLGEFFTSNTPLPNPRFLPNPGGENPATLTQTLSSSSEAYKQIAAYLRVDGPFNVNSTSIAAWEALLASNFGEASPSLKSGQLAEVQNNGVPVLRHSAPTGDAYEDTTAPTEADLAKWNGYRRLNRDQIKVLAKEIVAEIRKRGPFQSLAEFVNRRPGSDELAAKGAVDAAISRSGVNGGVLDPSHNLSLPGVTNPAAANANTADGAPGVINQADILTPLGPILTTRGDTFCIRAYGEASDDEGHLRKAWCETVVQRVPAYVNPEEAPTATPMNAVNVAFGRRFEIVSFRWLRPSDV